MREPYIGSVRFFKHLIIGAVLTLIILPVMLLFVVATKYHSLSLASDNSYNELDQANSRIEELEYTISGNQIQPEEDGMNAIEVTKTWSNILINEENPLPSDFEVTLGECSQGKQVDARIVKDMEQMLSDSTKAGNNLIICSGYRDLEYQMNLFNNSVRKFQKQGYSYTESFYLTKQSIEIPGDSEHTTGLAIDIIDSSYQTLDEKAEKTEGLQWMKEHCWEYGFILRYPKGKENITGIEYEPWHFRYVGKDLAKYLTEKELTLEEYWEMSK